MTKQRNPQAEQMADESMIRNLAAQADAIWPQEQLLLARYGLDEPSRTAPLSDPLIAPLSARLIADIGCGSGEITARLAHLYPQAQLIGIDILQSSVVYASRRYASLAPRVRFEQGDAFELALPDGAFDLVVCRHMTQAVPDPDKVLAQLHRICKPGGWLHVLSEDYGMLHMTPGKLNVDRLWHQGAIAYAHATGTDARVGRRTWSLMNELALEELRVDYVVVDTLRVPRATFAAILRAWGDGYAEHFQRHTLLTLEEAQALFDEVVASTLDPRQYAVWHVPIISGRKRQ